MNTETFAQLFKLNNFLEPELQKEIANSGKIMNAKAGDVLIREGQYLNFMPIVLSGSIRVFQQRDDREILLYYVKPGETCMMSLSSAYFQRVSAATGMATEPSAVVVFPAELIADWQLKYKSWNSFIIKTFRNRYDELLGAFGSVAFSPVQERVIRYLSKRSEDMQTKKLKLSHLTLANELGTTRVVISRILKQFEKEKKVKLSRGTIEVRL